MKEKVLLEDEIPEKKNPKDSAKQMSLAEFITENKPHPGLIASFKLEAENLEPRSQTAWEESFKAQSEKVYK